MSDASAFGFGKMVPGFDFLQQLARSAQANPAASNGAGWVAPTLSVEDIERRIQELRTVQFWLEQNSTALKATISALEVQKMTLSTLQGMNVNMADLARAFTARAPEAAAPTPPAPAPEPEPAPAPEPESAPESAEAAKPQAQAEAPVDPMKWWGSLTQQFQSIASAALQDMAQQAAPDAASSAAAPAKKTTQARASKAASKTVSKTPAKAAARPRAAAPAKASRRKT